MIKKIPNKNVESDILSLMWALNLAREWRKTIPSNQMLAILVAQFLMKNKLWSKSRELKMDLNNSDSDERVNLNDSGGADE